MRAKIRKPCRTSFRQHAGGTTNWNQQPRPCRAVPGDQAATAPPREQETTAFVPLSARMAVEVDDILVHEADAARRHLGADGPGLGRAVQPVESVAVAAIE